MDAKEATVANMAYQLKELKEAARAPQLAQRKTDIKAAVTAHKTAEAKRMVRLFIYFWFLPDGFLRLCL